MKRLRGRHLAIVLTFIFALAGSASTAQAKDSLLTVGTGGITGVYYPTGVAVADFVNGTNDQTGLRMAVESTTGSRYNLNAVASNELDFGIVQADVVQQSQTGQGSFKGQKGKPVSIIMTLGPEYLHVIARADSGIKTMKDLQGKRVNAGNIGSGQNETFRLIMDKMGWTDKDFAKMTNYKSNELAAALCGNKVDAVIFSVALQSAAVNEIVESCPSVFIGIDKEITDAIAADHSVYFRSAIPGGMYKGVPAEIGTMAVSTVFIANPKVSEEAAYQVVKAVFDNFPAFTKSHPALQSLKKEDVRRLGSVAPLHSGAAKYYKESGLL